MSRLEVITGPMFSGKTEELIRRLRREQISGRTVLTFKPHVDIRYDETKISSHNGSTFESFVVSAGFDVWELAGAFPIPDVIGIDEGQFFDDGIIWAINKYLEVKNKKVIICGLDKDFALQNFGPIPRLMVLADRVDKLNSVCNKCGADDASFTQRLVDGKPARFDGPTILVGGTESYEARCRDCFERG